MSSAVEAASGLLMACLLGSAILATGMRRLEPRLLLYRLQSAALAGLAVVVAHAAHLAAAPYLLLAAFCLLFKCLLVPRAFRSVRERVRMRPEPAPVPGSTFSLCAAGILAGLASALPAPAGTPGIPAAPAAGAALLGLLALATRRSAPSQLLGLLYAENGVTACVLLYGTGRPAALVALLALDTGVLLLWAAWRRLGPFAGWLRPPGELER